MSGCGEDVVTTIQQVVVSGNDPQITVIEAVQQVVVEGEMMPSINVITEIANVVVEGMGAQGEQGPPGPSGGTSIVMAASNISAFSVVALDGSGLAYNPSDTMLADASRIFGVAQVSALTGEQFMVTTTGFLDTPAVWTPGPLFVGPGGAMVGAPPTKPTDAYTFQIATAVSASRIIVNPLFPIVLA